MAIPQEMLGLAALGGLTAVIAACWSHIKGIFWRFIGLFISSVDVSESFLSDIVISHLMVHYRRWGNYDRHYAAANEFVRDQERRGYVAFETLGYASVVVWNGCFPVFLTVTRKPAANNYTVPTVTVRLTFVRGTFNVDRMIERATAERNASLWQHEDQTVGQFRRFYVRHVPPFDPGQGQALASNGSDLPWWQQGRIRLLGFRPEQLGQGPQNRRSALDDLVFPDHVVQLIEEVRLWRKSRGWYHERGIPWKRGWLLYGSPGTGKTALARAFAEDLDMPIWVYNLNELSNFAFMRYWTQMLASSPCIALVEDFDNVFHGRENVGSRSSNPLIRFRLQKAKEEGDEPSPVKQASPDEIGQPLGTADPDKQEFGPHGEDLYRSRLSFDCFLNMLDGIERNDGVFVIITTNHIDCVDEALGVPQQGPDGHMEFVSSRPGRIDKAIELTHLTVPDKLRLARKILAEYPEALADVERYVEVHGDRPETPAQFQERCSQLALACFWGRYRSPDLKLMRDETPATDEVIA